MDIKNRIKIAKVFMYTSYIVIFPVAAFRMIYDIVTQTNFNMLGIAIAIPLSIIVIQISYLMVIITNRAFKIQSEMEKKDNE